MTDLTGCPVEGLSPNRRESTGAGDVESAVRVAGGIPTLGGGLRAAAATMHVVARGEVTV